MSAFRQSVVPFVENLIKVNESTSDKKLGESAPCFLDQEGKFPPSAQSDRTNSKMADADELFDSACDRVVERFKVENLKDLQQKALQKLVNGEDVFVIQPTGSGKSLVYQSALMVSVVFGIVKRTTFQSIAVVISPLTSLMQDQVKFLTSIGVTAEFIGEDQQDNEAKKILLVFHR